MPAKRTLFDHITNITSVQNPKYWDTLDVDSKKTWSNYMIHRFLSMNPEWIEVLSEIQPYTCLLYTSPSPRDAHESRMPSSA